MSPIACPGGSRGAGVISYFEGNPWRHLAREEFKQMECGHGKYDNR